MIFHFFIGNVTNSCHTEIELYNPGYFVGLAIKSCPNFKFLKVQNIKNLNLRNFSPREIDTNSKLIKHIAKNCEKFEGLDIKEQIEDLSKEALELLIEKRKETLRILKLYGGNNKDDFLSKIPLCTKLEQFALNCKYIHLCVDLNIEKYYISVCVSYNLRCLRDRSNGTSCHCKIATVEEFGDFFPSGR